MFHTKTPASALSLLAFLSALHRVLVQMSGPWASNAPTAQTRRPQFLRSTELWTPPRGNSLSALESRCFFFLFICYSDLTPTPPHQGPPHVIVWEMGPRGALGLLQKASWFGWIIAILLGVHVAQFNLDLLNLLRPALAFDADVRM